MSGLPQRLPWQLWASLRGSLWVSFRVGFFSLWVSVLNSLWASLLRFVDRELFGVIAARLV